MGSAKQYEPLQFLLENAYIVRAMDSIEYPAPTVFFTDVVCGRNSLFNAKLICTVDSALLLEWKVVI